MNGIGIRVRASWVINCDAGGKRNCGSSEVCEKRRLVRREGVAIAAVFDAGVKCADMKGQGAMGKKLPWTPWVDIRQNVKCAQSWRSRREASK